MGEQMIRQTRGRPALYRGLLAAFMFGALLPGLALPVSASPLRFDPDALARFPLPPHPANHDRDAPSQQPEANAAESLAARVGRLLGIPATDPTLGHPRR